MFKTFLTALALALATPAAAQTIDRSEVESIVRDYLLANPEIISEMQQALEVKQAAEAEARAKQAIVEYRDDIFASANQGYAGAKDGDVTIVEFFDYNCGYCQRAMQDMNTLIEGDDQLKFVLKELPILGPGSAEASRISTAVYRLHPDRYAEFHNRLLGIPVAKDGAVARQIARDMGFDMEPLEAEAAKDDVIDAFREANGLANALGINGTPSYVIGDEVVFGALGADVLRQKVANMRACGSTECS
ncbi:MAG: DsbA family protein [Pseudomonadota bacterium]